MQKLSTFFIDNFYSEFQKVDKLLINWRDCQIFHPNFGNLSSLANEPKIFHTFQNDFWCDVIGSKLKQKTNCVQSANRLSSAWINFQLDLIKTRVERLYSLLTRPSISGKNRVTKICPPEKSVRIKCHSTIRHANTHIA